MTSAPPGPTSAPPGPVSPEPVAPGPVPPQSAPPGPVPVPVPPEPVSPGPVVLHGEVVHGPPPNPATSPGAWGGATYPQGPVYGPMPQQTPTYPGSGLTAADLVWNTKPEPSGGRIWKLTAAVIGVLAVLAGLGVGGYHLVGSRDDPKPSPTAKAGVATAKEIQKSLSGAGFECAPAFARPVPVDVCFRESPEYRESVGFQMIDADRSSWLRLWVRSNRPARHPAKDRAVQMFGSVIDQAIPQQDAAAAKTWLADMPDDYDKDDYLIHSVGGVSLKLLPHNKEWAVLWVQLTAATYQPVGESALPRVNPRIMEKDYTANGFKCRPATGGATCEDTEAVGSIQVSYRIDADRITYVRLTASPTSHLAGIAPTARQQTATLLGLILPSDQVSVARDWLERAFDGKGHHTVLSGVEVRVAPEKTVTEQREHFEVDVSPARW